MTEPEMTRSISLLFAGTKLWCIKQILIMEGETYQSYYKQIFKPFLRIFLWFMVLQSNNPRILCFVLQITHFLSLWKQVSKYLPSYRKTTNYPQTTAVLQTVKSTWHTLINSMMVLAGEFLKSSSSHRLMNRWWEVLMQCDSWRVTTPVCSASHAHTCTHTLTQSCTRKFSRR